MTPRKEAKKTPNSAQDLPIPFGVVAATGKTRPPLSPENIPSVKAEMKGVQNRARQGKRNGKYLSVVPTCDPRKLEEAGWGIVFAADINPAIKEALQPLIRYREQQVNNESLFKIFEGNKGVNSPAQSATDWLDRRGIGLAVVDPGNGVPLYLLLVGSPQQISFEFQNVLDSQWCVGRLHFDTPEEYCAYAEAVVAYETADVPGRGKKAAMWMTRNSGDGATAMLMNQVGIPFQQVPPGAKAGFKWTHLVEEKATKQELQNVLLDPEVSLLFTGSHGLEWSLEDEPGQRANQGALVTQDWVPNTPVEASQYFSAVDVPSAANLQGMIHFLFACFGGGCPTTDTFGRTDEGKPIPLAAQPMLAKLPQTLLSRGALAVLAHVDRAWSWSFQTGGGLPQNQVIRSTLDAIAMGLPIGLAADFFNLQWSTLAGLLQLMRAKLEGGLSPLTPASLSNLVVAQDDARNFVLLGDPAVRLRVDKMAPSP